MLAALVERLLHFQGLVDSELVHCLKLADSEGRDWQLVPAAQVERLLHFPGLADSEVVDWQLERLQLFGVVEVVVECELELVHSRVYLRLQEPGLEYRWLVEVERLPT